MSIKSKILAATAALTVVGGLGTVGALSASAATPPCGHRCIDIFSREFGTHHSPNYVLDVWRGSAKAGTPIILYRTSNTDKAEDFNVSFQGTVQRLLQRRPGLVRAEPALLAQLGVRVRVHAERRGQRPVHRHRQHRRPERHASRADAVRRLREERLVLDLNDSPSTSGTITCR